MKTSININLFGTLYAIDEDAHQLLSQYLDNMKSYFSRQEGGDEISDDIEHRVAELFWELKQAGNESITIEQVRSIIQEIGNPEDLGGSQTGNEARPTDDGQNTNNDGQQSTDGSQQFKQEIKDSVRNAGSKTRDWMSHRRYYRDPQDKMVGGVLSGLAHYFGNGDPIIWRLLFVVLTLFGLAIPIIPIYLIVWLCAPEAKTAEERLRMKGMEVNPENIKSQVLGYDDPSTSTQQNNSGCLGSFTGLMAICFKILLVLLAIPVLFVIAVVLFALFAVLFSLVASLFGLATGLTAGGTSLIGSVIAPEKWTILALVLAALAFIALIIYTIYRFFHRDRTPASGLTYIILFALMLLSALIGWTSINRLSQKWHDVDWSSVINGVDWDIDDDDWENRGSTVYCDSIYSIPAFNKVEVQGIARVIYRKGDSCSVRVNAADFLLKHTIIEEEDGKLLITQDDQLGHKHNLGNLNLKVYVTAPYLTNLWMRGIGKVEFDGQIEQEQPMRLELEGIGKVDIENVTCPKLEVVNKGAGKVDIKAYVDSLIVSNEGIGKIDIEGRAYSYQRNNEGIGKIDDNELKIGM